MPLDFFLKMRFAYCTLVMKGDAYIPGALTMGYSLRQVASQTDVSVGNIDIIIMITHDVSEEGRYMLSKVFDHIIEVPYITYKTFRVFYKEHITRDRYSSWMGSSYTKWNALNLTQYNKIFFLDADVIAVKNIDDIFDFATPAGIFTSPHDAKDENYKGVKIGEKIPLKNIYDALNYRGIIVTGNAVLLSPSKRDYKGYISMMNKIVKNNPSKGFGFNTESSVDEQSITHYYWTKKKLWTILPNNVNTTPWKLDIIKIPYEKMPNSPRKISNSSKTISKIRHVKINGKKLDRHNLIICQMPHIIHYSTSINVWNMNPDSPDTYDDINVWWLLACNFMSNNGKFNKPLTSSDIKKLEEIYNIKKYGSCVIKPVCFWCKYLNEKFNNKNISYDHDIIDKKNKLICPRLKTC